MMATLLADCGYPLEWFAQPVDDNFKCGICCHVMRDPTATKCGHVYCAKCISSWVSYYGVCPERCRDLEISSLKPSPQLAKLISGLAVQCKNKTAGCRTRPSLDQKHFHEQSCPFGGTAKFNLKLFSSASFSLSQQDLFGSSSKGCHKRTNSSGILQTSTSRIRSLAKRSPSSAAAFCRPTPSHHRAMPVAMNPKGSYSTLIFRLKRTKAKEPLGLVLVSGEKTADGRPTSFHVKKVHPDTLGWKAGLKAGDRIVQVDHHELTSISPPEAVARIKEKTLVTLTVQRGGVASSNGSGGSGEHVYDEIFYSDLSQQSQHSSQQDENTPLNMATFPRPRGSGGRINAINTVDDGQRYYRQPPAPSSPAPPPPMAFQHHHTHHHPLRSTMPAPHRAALPPHHASHHAKPRQGMEKGSKDSGLSSGSSTHQEGGGAGEHAWTGKSRHRRLGSQGSQGSHPGVPQWVEQCSNENCRIEGNYEVEDIYLQKNGTSQLGITLGYDTKAVNGQLVVCDVLPNGLAAQNGHLKNGDIVRRVNGFEVHDPEEAVLLFLEQDQDITLSVARPLKVVPGPSQRYPGGPPPYPPPPPIDTFPDNVSITSSNSSSTCNPVLQDDRTYAVLDAPRDTHFRRVDSCGSLDSRRHRHSPIMGVPPTAGEVPVMMQHLSQDTGSENMMRRTKSASSTSKPSPSRKRDGPKSHSPPAPVRQPSPLVTDSQQQPVYHVLQQPGSPQEQGQPQIQPQGVQQPVYHVLQQPGSPQQMISPQPPVYEALEVPDGSPKHLQQHKSEPPVYHVLQQPDNSASSDYDALQPPDNSIQARHQPDSSIQPRHQPDSSRYQPDNSIQMAFQHEEFQSLSLTRNRSKGKMSTQQAQRRAASTTPHHKHLIDTSEAPPPSSCKPSPPRTFRSISNEVSHQRCETAPADYLQSLV